MCEAYDDNDVYRWDFGSGTPIFRLRFANELPSAGRDGAAAEGRAEWPPYVVNAVPWVAHRDQCAARPSDRQAARGDIDGMLTFPTVDPFGEWAVGAGYQPMSSSSGTAIGREPGTRKRTSLVSMKSLWL